MTSSAACRAAAGRRRHSPRRPRSSIRSACRSMSRRFGPTRSRAAAGDPGETKTVAYLTDQFAKAGLQPGGDLVDGKRSWTQAVPLLRSEFTARAAGQPRHRRQGRRPLTQGEQIAVRAPTNGDKAMIDRRRAAGVRRLRRQGARARLGRFQGPGRAGQDHRRAGQRPRFRRRRRRFRRQGDDLLRPLDLQV